MSRAAAHIVLLGKPSKFFGALSQNFGRFLQALYKLQSALCARRAVPKDKIHSSFFCGQSAAFSSAFSAPKRSYRFCRLPLLRLLPLSLQRDCNSQGSYSFNAVSPQVRPKNFYFFRKFLQRKSKCIRDMAREPQSSTRYAHFIRPAKKSLSQIKKIRPASIKKPPANGRLSPARRA